MTVYVEYVLINNFIIDYVLLYLSQLLAKKHVKKTSTLIASFIGAIISLVYPLVEKYFILSILLKICTGMLLVAVSAKFNGIKEYFSILALFFLLSISIGGALYGASIALKVPNDSEIFTAITFVPVLVIGFAVKGIICGAKNKQELKNYYCVAEIFVKTTSVKATAFIDSGNKLKKDGKPVVIVSKNLAKKLLSDCTAIKSITTLEYSTIMGTSTMPTFIANKIEIYIEKDKHIIESIIVGINNGKSQVGYEIILPLEIIKKGETSGATKYSNQTKENIKSI